MSVIHKSSILLLIASEYSYLVVQRDWLDDEIVTTRFHRRIRHRNHVFSLILFLLRKWD